MAGRVGQPAVVESTGNIEPVREAVNQVDRLMAGIHFFLLLLLLSPMLFARSSAAASHV